MNFPQIFSRALTIGEKMLCSGAEVSRVEDSIVRICTAYGAERVDVFAITSSIVASAVYEGEVYSQSRRIKHHKTDLSMLDRLNSLSREICNTKPSLEYLDDKITEITSRKGFGIVSETLFRLLAAASFTVFFGGNIKDCIVSSVIGMLLMLSVRFTSKYGFNKFFSNIVNSFFISILAFGVTGFVAGINPDKIIIGNIMMLIPGLALTNSIRDLIDGDIMSGVLGFLEACLIALAIAGGFFIAVALTGGALV